MDIQFFLKKSSKNKQIASQTKYKNKPIIIIPKKKVKKAYLRNKIRRQIRVILRQNDIKNCVVKYNDNDNRPNFNTLNSVLKTIFLTKK